MYSYMIDHTKVCVILAQMHQLKQWDAQLMLTWTLIITFETVFIMVSHGVITVSHGVIMVSHGVNNGVTWCDNSVIWCNNVGSTGVNWCVIWHNVVSCDQSGATTGSVLETIGCASMLPCDVSMVTCTGMLKTKMGDLMCTHDKVRSTCTWSAPYCSTDLLKWGMKSLTCR